MKLSRNQSARACAAGLGVIIGGAAAILLLAGPLACGGRKTQSDSPAPTRVSTQDQRDQSFVVPLKEQRRWIYEIEPSPPLHKKPAYLLKTIGFAANSSGIDNEAAAVCRDLAALMKDRERVRVLFLGLADQGTEKLNAENLGLTRAKTIREFVTGQGIDKARTEMATFGAKVATGDPSDKIAQEKDRRVEVWLIEE